MQDRQNNWYSERLFSKNWEVEIVDSYGLLRAAEYIEAPLPLQPFSIYVDAERKPIILASSVGMMCVFMRFSLPPPVTAVPIPICGALVT